MSNTLDKRFSITDLLDDINTNPDDIDLLVIGDITLANKRSNASSVKGLNSFLEVVGFIDRFGRPPLTTSLDFEEKRLAFRMQGYVRNPDDYSELIPYDKHHLINNLTADSLPDSVAMFSDISNLDDATAIIDSVDSTAHNPPAIDGDAIDDDAYDAKYLSDDEEFSDEFDLSDEFDEAIYDDNDANGAIYGELDRYEPYDAYDLPCELDVSAGKSDTDLDIDTAYQDVTAIVSDSPAKTIDEVYIPELYIETRLCCYGSKFYTDGLYFQATRFVSNIKDLVSTPATLEDCQDVECASNPHPTQKEVYLAVHIDDRRYQDYINPQSCLQNHAEQTPALRGTNLPARNPAKVGTARDDQVVPPKTAIDIDADFELTSSFPDVTKPTECMPDDELLSIDDILDTDFDFLEDITADDNEWFADGYKTTPASASKPTVRPDEIGKQTPCEDFYLYEPKFNALHDGLESGSLKTIRHTQTNMREGDAFILEGMVGFIDSMTSESKGRSNSHDPRLRLIFDNKTESNILLSSLNKRLYTDKTGRRVIRPSDEFTDFDTVVTNPPVKVRTGQLYIVRSLSSQQSLRVIPNLYKIGFTTLTVQERASNARNDTAFLESPVEVVATAECYNLNPRGLESIVHDFLYAQRVQTTLLSKDGKTYNPKEWFSVDVRDAKRIIQLIVDGDIVDYRMDNTTGRLVER